MEEAIQIKKTKQSDKTPRGLALEKIEHNIKALCRNSDLQKNLEVIRKTFHIYPGIYERYL